MLEDTPDDYIHDVFSQNFWQGHPLGMPIIGNEKSVGGLSRDFIVTYKQETYRAGDIIIAAAGKVNHQELLRLLDGLFTQVPPGKNRHESRQPTYEKKLTIVEKDLEQVHLCLGTRALPQNHQRRYEAYILNTVLGGSMSSRLFQEVREKLGLAYSIYSYMASHSDTGSLAVYAGTSLERLHDVVDIVLRELRKLKTEPLSEAELDAAKEQLKGNILLSLEGSDNRMSKLAKNEIYFGCYQSVQEMLHGFDRVTVESLRGLCEQLIDDECFTLVMMGKLNKESLTLQNISL